MYGITVGYYSIHALPVLYNKLYVTIA